MAKTIITQILLPICLLLSSASHATPISKDDDSISCAQWVLPVHAVADNLIFDTPHVDSSIDVANYVWYSDNWSTPNITVRTRSIFTVDQTWGINVKLCIPAASAGNKSETLQIATHGLGFDGRYWDAEVEPHTYSYMRAAAKAGYSILAYDRLGTGYSDKPDAYDIVQAPLQVEILKSLTVMARNGSLIKAAKPHFRQGLTLPQFTKFVHIGHSFGSVVTHALQAKYPELTDGSIQTGWLINTKFGSYGQGAFGYEYAREWDPVKFGDRGSGYIVTATRNAFQQLFFAKDLMDPKMLDYGNSIKQPGTVGEAGPTATVIGIPAPNFTGPQLVFMGARDLPICSGDCYGTYDLDTVKNYTFPKASALEIYIQPGTGHGLTLHQNATAGYQVMFDFLNKNGL